MAHQEATDIHTLIYYTCRESSHLATYFICRQNTTLMKGVIRGADHTQAICRAVQATLTALDTIPTPYIHLLIWLRSQTLCNRILTLTSHRDLFPTRELHTRFETLLLTQPRSIHLCTFDKKWLGTPKQAELRSLDQELLIVIRDPIPLPLMPPHMAMWEKIHCNYTPSHKPTYMACTPPLSPIPPPAIHAAAASHSRLMSSTIFQWATGHSFDADYSDRFRPGADDPTTCPCYITPLDPHPTPHAPLNPQRHMKKHIIFHCACYLTQCLTHLVGLHSLRTIFSSEEHTTCLCEFTLTTNCSLLRPLPHTLHAPVPWPDPP